LTITDGRNGDFVQGYNLYANDEFVTVLMGKMATLTDYIEHTETIEVKIQATGEKFNNSADSNIETWVKNNVDGTPGLAYELSSDGTYAICTGIGTATNSEIEIASIFNGVPVTKILTKAFFKNTNITKVIIGENITDIESFAFSTCTNLSDIVFNDNIIKFGQAAINDTAVKYITVSAYIDTQQPFFNNKQLLSITFKQIASVNRTQFGSQYLGWCRSLKRIDLSLISDKFINLSYKGDIPDSNDDLQIKVPANLIGTYKNATNWCDIADKIVAEFTNEV
jgi:hypothetical protein